MAIKARMKPKFPARVLGGTGVTITKANGVYTVDFDLSAELLALSALTPTDGNFIVGTGAAWAGESGATARTSLGLGSMAIRGPRP